MSELKEVIEEVLEMVEYVCNNNSNLKKSLRKKEVGSNIDVKELENDIKNVSSDYSRGILENELKNIEKKRFEELKKRYGRLIFSDTILGIKKKKEDGEEKKVVKKKKQEVDKRKCWNIKVIRNDKGLVDAKFCSKCFEYLDVESFEWDDSREGYLLSWCKVCNKR